MRHTNPQFVRNQLLSCSFFTNHFATSLMRFVVIFIISFLSFSPAAKAAADSSIYNIQFKIRGLKATKVVLGYHFGDQNFLVDSTNVDTLTGSLRFASRRKLPEGVYFIAHTEGSSKGILFDFILAGDRDFLIETTVNAPIDSANIDRSMENIQFFNYQKKARQVQTGIADMRSMREMLQRAKADRATLMEQDKKMYEKAQELDVFTVGQIQKYPDSYTSKLMKMLRNPTVPSNLKPYSDDKKPNPNYGFWYRQHYFDEVDFSDERLLRSPYYTAKLGQFVGQIVPASPDSMTYYLDFLLEKTRTRNLTVYQFTLRWLTNLFDSNIEKPFSDTYLVHLVEKYQHAADAGTDNATLQRLDYKVVAFRPNLVGNTAPPILLPNTEGSFVNLSDSKSDYTLLIFFSALCKHCKETMPKIQQALQMTDSSKISVFTVCTDGLKEAWKDFLSEQKMTNWTNVLDTKTDSDIQKKYATWNLPTLYLINKEQKIVAKRLKAEDLPEIVKAIFSEKK
jgi:peroxiredoxin